MARVVPTVTAYSPAEYKTQIEAAASLSSRVSLDFMDGDFTPNKNINLVQAYWPPHLEVDIHLMYQKPEQQLETLISMKPSLVVLHAEAEGNLESMFKQLKAVGIKCGLAFLPSTQPADFAHLLKSLDHALLFSGNLGEFGGQADLHLLTKAGQVRLVKPDIEISWDGGVNAANAKQIVNAGVAVLNVGGYIQNAPEPHAAYAKLEAIVKGVA